ncbi:HAMP domain-containing sensor histidine kinase [Tardiphaga sp. 709]|uniref:sensor histidine kinase n=1 Tax=Tardiphaga sp. 709 TaxID=3076039 RepID=UPI0028E29BFE|nr:HAMP domain-containing sensor histidine kinase [Tardiphaga sp. 709]WNV07792.1 HAMP domain-containing sensor histidine kinase [Tardiphaga sp. 709]
MRRRISVAVVDLSRLAARLCVCILVWMSAPTGSAGAAERSEVKRVLLLHSFGREFRPWSEYAASIKAELQQQSPWPLDIQEHGLLTARFNSPGPEAPFVDYLNSLYQSHPADIVLSIGAPAARFVQKYRERLFPETPMVLTVVEQRLVNRVNVTDNDTVISVRNDFLAAFRNILQVLPETQTIAVVIGASALEKFWLEELKRELKPLEDRVNFVYYADLSFAEILKRASVLPPHTVLFWGLMSVDSAGVVHEGDLALRSLHAVANAPIFSYQEPFFNGETVGGPMHSIAETSKKTVNAAIRILGGEKPGDIKFEPIEFAAPKYDWRKMQRWGISESNLPPGSTILFREPDIWVQYRWQILLTASVILVQAGLISALLQQRRRRRLAEVEVRQRLAELAHVNRYSAAGEFTTSIAHELNQPLGSILTNTETAEFLLKETSPNLAEVREILADIRRDDQRASEVIRRLRSVLKKTPFEIRDIDLNDTVREAIGFVAALADRRGVVLKFAAASGELRIKGDPVQLQQVILNLIINGMDAVSEADARVGEVSVSTARLDQHAEIRIGDTGPGIVNGDMQKVFDPFFSTKPQGLGMGLAIARTIVEAHNGRISAVNQESGGALFIITIPIARGRLTPL